MSDPITREFSNIIPAEISSEIKMGKNASMKVVIFVIAFLSITQQFTGLVHSNLQILYMLFSLLAGIVLVLPCGRGNPEKKIYDGILYSFLKDRNVYHPIPHLEAPNEEK